MKIIKVLLKVKIVVDRYSYEFKEYSCPIDWKKEAIKSLDIEMNQHHPFYDANISLLKSKILSEGCYERKQ